MNTHESKSGQAKSAQQSPQQATRVKWSSGEEPPRHSAPAGTTDCHHHIFGAQYPLTSKPSMTLGGDGNATPDEYRALQRRVGIERHVVVGAAAYGTDNTCLLDALASFGPSARGIALVDTGIGDAELERMSRAGVCGIRVNLVYLSGATLEMIEPLAHRIHALGWHLQLSMPADVTAQLEPVLMRLPTRLVFDHVARIPPDPGTAHPAFSVIRRLVDRGRAWVKLSGAYLLSKTGAPYADTGAVARAFAAAAPERMLWASNWPHPTEKAEKPDDALLFDLLAEWAPSEAARRRILVENPQEIYGFE